MIVASHDLVPETGHYTQWIKRNYPEHAADYYKLLNLPTKPGENVTMNVETGGDTGALRTVADQIGVPFVPRTDAAPLAALLPADNFSGRAVQSTAAAGGIETYWLPALGAAVLVLIELYLTLRDFRRSRLTGLDAPR